jgi:hypothetical protein
VAVKIRFNKAEADGIVLAKVGNPQRDEALQTSREVSRIADGDRSLLTSMFLKPFKSLAGYRFHHHSDLEQNEVHACSKAIFSSPDELLERGCEIAKRLYAKSNHPNIKSGDLCITLMRKIIVDGQATDGLCILKSESVEPFLSITSSNGDLKISTEKGINPEKIDKGCLILNHQAEQGFHVLTFDRSGGESRFWVREFLGVQPISDDSYLTGQYAEMAVAFMEDENEGEEVVQRTAAKKRAVDYFDKREKFSLQEFEEEVLRKDPKMVAKFREQKERVEAEKGQSLDDEFGISKKEVNRARRRVGGLMRLDTGVELRLLPQFQDGVLEKGYDEERGMAYVKVYYNSDLAPGAAGGGPIKAAETPAEVPAG